MTQIPYRIHFRRGDVEIEVQGDKKYVTRVFGEMKNLIGGNTLVRTPVGVAASASSSIPSAGKPVSAREFLDQYSSVSKHTDIVLAFGYYLEKRKGLPGFSAVDLNKCYYDAKIEPSNTSQMIIQNTRKGFMMESPETKAGRRKYVLTNKGESYVEAGFRKAAKD